MKGTTDERRAEPFIGGFALGWDDYQRSPLLYSIKMRMGYAVEACRQMVGSATCIGLAKGSADQPCFFFAETSEL